MEESDLYEVDNWLGEQEPDLDELHDKVDLLDYATTLLHRVRAARHRMDLETALYRKARAKLDAFLEDRTRADVQLIADAERTLESLTRRLYAITPEPKKGEKVRSWKVEAGTIRLRKPIYSLVVDDEAAAVEALRAHGDAKLIRASVAVAEVKRLASGKLIDSDLLCEHDEFMYVAEDGALYRACHTCGCFTTSADGAEPDPLPTTVIAGADTDRFQYEYAVLDGEAIPGVHLQIETGFGFGYDTGSKAS